MSVAYMKLTAVVTPCTGPLQGQVRENLSIERGDGQEAPFLAKELVLTIGSCWVRKSQFTSCL